MLTKNLKNVKIKSTIKKEEIKMKGRIKLEFINKYLMSLENFNC